MFKRAEVNERNQLYDEDRVGREMEVTVQKLQALRSRILELRAQCEELKKLSSKTVSSVSSVSSVGNCLLCTQCGEPIEPDQEILVKNPDGTEKGHYHRECFKLFWV